MNGKRYLFLSGQLSNVSVTYFISESKGILESEEISWSATQSEHVYFAKGEREETVLSCYVPTNCFANEALVMSSILLWEYNIRKTLALYGISCDYDDRLYTAILF